MLASCAIRRQNSDFRTVSVPYVQARHYFFNNDVPVPVQPMVTTRGDFNRLFGMAAVMGRGGEPTPIDFSRQFAIAVVLPLTNDHTTVEPGVLVAHGDTLTLHYRVRIGRRATMSTMRPMTLLVVDRRYLSRTCLLVRD